MEATIKPTREHLTDVSNEDYMDWLGELRELAANDNEVIDWCAHMDCIEYLHYDKATPASALARYKKFKVRMAALKEMFN